MCPDLKRPRMAALHKTSRARTRPAHVEDERTPRTEDRSGSSSKRLANKPQTTSHKPQTHSPGASGRVTFCVSSVELSKDEMDTSRESVLELGVNASGSSTTVVRS